MMRTITRSSWNRWWVVALALAVANGLQAQQRAPDDDAARAARERWFRQQREYPQGQIPSGSRARALMQMRQLAPAAGNARRSGLSGAITASGSPGAWTALGPTAILNTGTIWSSRFSGRVSAIVPHPTDPSVVYVATARGGVWKTADRGATWTPLMDQACSLAFGSLAIDPVNPQILYAGTGDYPWEPGCGILRSVDGGTSWTPLVLPPPPQVPRGFGSSHVNRIAIIPSTAGSLTATTVVAATGLGLYRSTNSGASWMPVLSNNWYLEVEGLVIDPNDEHVLYAAVHDYYSQGREGIYKSTDAGATWTMLAGLPSNGANDLWLAISHSKPAVLYAAFQRATDDLTLGLYMSTDGGATWQQRAGAGILEFGWSFEVDPKNQGTVYWGGVALRVSTDSGSTFTSLPVLTHPDNHAIVWSTAEPAMYLANDGGLYRSMDGGATWDDLNNGLVITQYYHVAIEPGKPNHLMAGAQDNGIDEFTGQPLWAWPYGGDGGFVSFDPMNPSTQYGTIQWIPGVNYPIGPMRRDAGRGFVQKSVGIDQTERGSFIPPLIPDPSGNGVLYFGTYRVYRTANRGDTWSPVGGDLTKGQGFITTIAVAPSSANVVYAGTSDGNVQVTADGGATWRLAAGIPDRWVTAFAIDPADARHAYVVVSGYGSGHIFQTTDEGQSWQDLSGNLPDLPVNAVVFIPSTQQLYLGTDLGVVYGGSAGGVWAPAMNGFPNTTVNDMAYDASSGTLVAATYGRGIFSLQVSQVVALHGDVNLDGQVTAVDAQAILDVLVGLPIPKGWSAVVNGDADCDGKVTAADAQLILSYALGLPTNGACVGTRK